MAYPTCPECRTAQPVGDESVGFRCMSCFQEIVFGQCSACGTKQAIPRRYEAFTCMRCFRKADVDPHVRDSQRPTAAGVSEIGLPFPSF